MLHSTPDTGRRLRDAPEPRTAEQDFVSFSDVWRFARRYSLTIGAVLCIGLLLAAAHVYRATPRYTATAQILIDPATIQIVRDPTPGQTPALDAAQVEGNIAVLRSESLATSVINRLGLMRDPEFQPGRPSRMKQLVSVMLRGLVSPPEAPKGDLADFIRLRYAIDAFLGNLDVRRAGQSYAISISFTSGDAGKAAEIANAVAEQYIQDQLKANARAAQQGSEWLEQRLTQLRTQLNTAARQLEAFRAGRDIRLPQQRQDTAKGAGAPAEGGTAPEARPVQRDTDPGGGAGTGRAVTLTELESTAESYRRTYETYQQAFADAVQRQSFPVSNARIITAATRPLTKSEPRPVLTLAFGGLTGLLLGFGVAFLRHAMDDSVRSARQIREQTDLPSLALIPVLEKAPRQLPPAVRARFENLQPPGIPLPQAQDEFRAAIDAPFSPFSGSLKALKAAIAHTHGRRELKCIGVTSSLPGEGKSTVAANLAALYAAGTSRTLVIDCDIHRAIVSQYFAPGADAGLLEVLAEKVRYDAAIKAGAGLAPDILPVALTDEPVSYDLLTSPKMQALLAALRDRYDVVIADLPPVNPVIDAAAIGALLDGVVLVAEWGKTPMDVLTGAAGVLFTAQANVLGVALNKVDKSLATVRWQKDWGYGYYRKAAAPVPRPGDAEAG